MRSSTLRMADSCRHSTRHRHAVSSLSQLLPTDPHAAVIVGQTGCGKTVFCLDLLEGPYRGVFRHIVFLCPTILHNKTYKDRTWIWADPEVYVIDPGERFVLCIRSSRVSRPFTSSTIALRPRLSPRRRTCCPSWLLVAATPAPLSGCSLRNLTQSGRTSESKQSGLLSFIAKTGTRSRTACVKMMWSPQERREQRLGSYLQRQSMQS